MVPLLQRAQAERGGGFTPIGGRKARRKQQATVSDWRCMCPEPSFDGPAYEFNGSTLRHCNGCITATKFPAPSTGVVSENRNGHRAGRGADCATCATCATDFHADPVPRCPVLCHRLAWSPSPCPAYVHSGLHPAQSAKRSTVDGSSAPDAGRRRVACEPGRIRGGSTRPVSAS